MAIIPRCWIGGRTLAWNACRLEGRNRYGERASRSQTEHFQNVLFRGGRERTIFIGPGEVQCSAASQAAS
jgi:hypothetical protein